MSITSNAFTIGRKLGKHPFTSKMFCMVEPLLPLNRVGRSEDCVAFHHPRPLWDPHILVVPTVPFPAIGITAIPWSEQCRLIWEMAELAAVVAEEHYPSTPLTMIINGGVRQDIGQVHGHLTTLPPPELFTTRVEIRNPLDKAVEWEQIRGSWGNATRRPQNGYSLIIEVSSHASMVAWLTQTLPQPVQGNTDAQLTIGGTIDTFSP